VVADAPVVQAEALRASTVYVLPTMSTADGTAPRGALDVATRALLLSAKQMAAPPTYWRLILDSTPPTNGHRTYRERLTSPARSGPQPTTIGDYAAWVYLNIRDGIDIHADVDQQVADALKQPGAEVLSVRQRLAAGGLVDTTGRLTPLGQEQLHQGRELVAATTDKLTEGIDPQSLKVAGEVLETVRHRAEKELSG
jgi:hypothetical protein